MKQTAVEQMLKELQEKFPKQMAYMYNSNQLLLEDIALKAQEMEKQQIIDACNQTDVIGLDHEQPGQQYYNETFNTKEK